MFISAIILFNPNFCKSSRPLISPDQQKFTVLRHEDMRETTNSKCKNGLSELLSGDDFNSIQVLATVRLHVSSVNSDVGLELIRGPGKEPIGVSARVLVFYAATG